VSERGQATTEYLGLLALAACLLASAGFAVGLGDVGTAVASTVRTGICIVAGGVCRSSDAAALGLAPCTVGERSSGGGTAVAIAWARIGGSDGLVIATRSDGSVLVTETEKGRAGAVAGIGLEASPLGLDVGIEGGVDYTITSGKAWEFPDAASAARFIGNDARDSVPPTWRFGDAGGALSLEAKAGFRGTTLAGIGASAGAASGARVGRGVTTLYVRAKIDSGAKAWLPGRSRRIAGPSTGDVMVEITLAGGAPRELAIRSVGRPAGGGQVVDTVARLDLRDPVNRHAADGVLGHALPWPPDLAHDLGALALLAVRRGVVERSVYDVRDDSSDFELGAKLGLALGLEHEDIDIERRLVAASAWVNGSQEMVREDCTGVTAEPLPGTS
jgi:hypothetical protein